MTDKKAEYAKCIGFWNEVFAREVPVFPKAAKTGIEKFDAGIAWLADGSESVVDFGCGNGTLLFICRNLGLILAIRKNNHDSGYEAHNCNHKNHL